VRHLYQDILHALGLGLCHQLPERSFIFGGIQSPVCARCAGIYVGIILTLLFLFLFYRKAQRAGVPALPFFIGAAIGVIVMGVDGVGSYLGLHRTNNFVRVLTGIMFGAGLAPIIYSLLVETLARYRSPKKIMDTTHSVALWAAVIPAGLLLVYGSGLLLGPLAAGFQGLLIFVTFWLIALIIIGCIPRFEHSVKEWRDLIAPLLLAFPVAVSILLLCMVLQLWAMGVLL